MTHCWVKSEEKKKNRLPLSILGPQSDLLIRFHWSCTLLLVQSRFRTHEYQMARDLCPCNGKKEVNKNQDIQHWHFCLSLLFKNRTIYMNSLQRTVYVHTCSKLLTICWHLLLIQITMYKLDSHTNIYLQRSTIITNFLTQLDL